MKKTNSQEFEEFFNQINTTKAKQHNAYQIKQYGYLRAAGESVTKEVWDKSQPKPKPKKDYSAILATLKP